MKFFTYGKTDIGLEKKQNQDSFLLKKANTSIGELAFAVVCDGMGGLEQGEVASSAVIRAFEEWFNISLPDLIKFGMKSELLKQQWTSLINELNIKISEYGASIGISLGTTISAILITQEKYYCINVGDSRTYVISQDSVCQITTDQSLVQRKIEQGIISEKEAHDDPDRSILLQCIGSSPDVLPDFYEGDSCDNMVYMLCSDGFRHEITTREIQRYLSPTALINVETIDNNTQYLIELNKERQETDNITVILIRTF